MAFIEDELCGECEKGFYSWKHLYRRLEYSVKYKANSNPLGTNYNIAGSQLAIYTQFNHERLVEPFVSGIKTNEKDFTLEFTKTCFNLTNNQIILTIGGNFNSI